MWRLGRREQYSDVAARTDPYDEKCDYVSNRGRLRQSQVLMFLALAQTLHHDQADTRWLFVPSRHGLERID